MSDSFSIHAQPAENGRNVEVQVYIPRSNGLKSFMLRCDVDPKTIRRLAEELLEVCRLLEQT